MFDPLIVLLLALAIDLAFGEPPRRLHLTVWMGRFIEAMEPRMRRLKNERAAGVLLAVFTVASFTTMGFLVSLIYYYNFVIWVAASAFFLKMMFALRCMFEHINPIISSLEAGDIEGSRKYLSMVVRRDTSTLDQQHIASGAVETVAEGFVDGFISPLFFYLLFGLPGAVAYRAINTLDSMVGYKDERYLRFGWASAKLDTIANYIPSRLTYLIFALASFILKMDWRGALKIGRVYHASTPSLNAGWPMSTMAGALRVRLEKIGSYTLGEDLEPLSPKKIKDSLNVYAVSAAITVLLFSILIAARSF
jgi:adenosylcobinamide-phosphate synthase